jgi:hypothetical protein
MLRKYFKFFPVLISSSKEGKTGMPATSNNQKNPRHPRRHDFPSPLILRPPRIGLLRVPIIFEHLPRSTTTQHFYFPVRGQQSRLLFHLARESGLGSFLSPQHIYVYIMPCAGRCRRPLFGSIRGPLTKNSRRRWTEIFPISFLCFFALF